MKKSMFMMLGVVIVLLFGSPVSAHFGMVLPSDSMVMQGENKAVDVKLSFSHPYERIGMELVKPEAFGVIANGEKQDLLGELKQMEVMDHKAWEADYKIKRPGVYMFYMVPAPYWEPAEDLFIVHYTKTVVTAFGIDDGWDEEIGLKTEIVPLSKPYGLYAGNVFQGIVKVDGEPAPFAEVEVEYYNQSGKAEAPTDYMITQTIKADANGVFTYAAPVAGWWGFAALSSSDETIEHEGEEKGIEIGAVLWVRFHDWQTTK